MADSAITQFREFMLSGLSGKQLELFEIYAAIKQKFPALCDDSLLCTHENPHRPEWQHQVRQALDYLKNKTKQISLSENAKYTF